jgi:hypothetical protein
MSTPEIEARLTILETEVARLKQQLPISPIPWWQTILGTFANDPTYDEAMQLGQQYRQSLRPDSDSSVHV